MSLRIRARAPAILSAGLMMLLGAAGCSKHEWLSQRRTGAQPGGTAGFDSTGRGGPARSAPEEWRARPGDSAQGTQSTSAAPPPQNPADMGGMAAPAPEDAIRELRWEPTSPTAGNGAGATGAGPSARAVDCSAGPCYWIQVAALADSSGAAAALATAAALASRAGVPPPAPGGSVSREARLWKVRLGPWSRWEDADAALRTLRSGGFGGAWLVRQGGNSG